MLEYYVMTYGAEFITILAKIGIPLLLLSKLFRGPKKNLRSLFISCGLYKEQKSFDKGQPAIKLTPEILSTEETEYGSIVTLRLLEGMCVDDFIAKRQPMQEYLDAEVRFRYISEAKFEMEIITAKLPDVVDFEIIPSSDILTIPIGMTRKDVKWLNLSESFSNILLGGMVGSGKSSFIRCILCYIILYTIPTFKLMELWLVDLKMGMEFSPFRKCKYVMEYADDLDPAFDLLEKTIRIIKERGRLYEKLGVNSTEAYNREYGMTMGYHNYILIAFDEVANITDTGSSKLDNYADSLLSYIGRTGRALGVKVLAATQRPDKDVVKGSIKNNFLIRICLKVTDGINSKIILDEMGGERLKGQGHGIIKTDITEEFQGYWLDAKEVSKLIFEAGAYKEEILELMDSAIGVIPNGDTRQGSDSDSDIGEFQCNYTVSDSEASPILVPEETKGSRKKKNGKNGKGRSL